MAGVIPNDIQIDLNDNIRKKIIPQYGAGCGFVSKAHPLAHIEICAGGWNAGDGTTGKKDVELFFSEALRQRRRRYIGP
jgi:hypothetical protein